jgi:hypothetical protein
MLAPEPRGGDSAREVLPFAIEPNTKRLTGKIDVRKEVI